MSFEIGLDLFAKLLVLLWVNEHPNLIGTWPYGIDRNQLKLLEPGRQLALFHCRLPVYALLTRFSSLSDIAELLQLRDRIEFQPVGPSLLKAINSFSLLRNFRLRLLHSIASYTGFAAFWARSTAASQISQIGTPAISPS